MSAPIAIGNINRAVKDRSLSPAEANVLVTIYLESNTAGKVSLTVKDLVKLTARKASTVRACLSRLVEKGHIVELSRSGVHCESRSLFVPSKVRSRPPQQNDVDLGSSVGSILSGVQCLVEEEAPPSSTSKRQQRHENKTKQNTHTKPDRNPTKPDSQSEQPPQEPSEEHIEGWLALAEEIGADPRHLRDPHLSQWQAAVAQYPATVVRKSVAKNSIGKGHPIAYLLTCTFDAERWKEDGVLEVNQPKKKRGKGTAPQNGYGDQNMKANPASSVPASVTIDQNTLADGELTDEAVQRRTERALELKKKLLGGLAEKDVGGVRVPSLENMPYSWRHFLKGYEITNSTLRIFSSYAIWLGRIISRYPDKDMVAFNSKQHEEIRAISGYGERLKRICLYFDEKTGLYRG